MSRGNPSMPRGNPSIAICGFVGKVVCMIERWNHIHREGMASEKA
jgi:hypothetical protein